MNGMREVQGKKTLFSFDTLKKTYWFTSHASYNFAFHTESKNTVIILTAIFTWEASHLKVVFWRVLVYYS